MYSDVFNLCSTCTGGIQIFFVFLRNSVLAPVLKVSDNNAIFSCESFLKVSKGKMEFTSINYDLTNNVSSHPQNSNKKLANIQEEPKKYISSYF